MEKLQETIRERARVTKPDVLFRGQCTQLSTGGQRWMSLWDRIEWQSRGM